MQVDLIQKLKERQREYQRLGVDLIDPVKFIDSLVEDLIDVNHTLWEEPLTLLEAARESGYSVDHLARLVRQQVIPNAGHKRRPRILRKDLPRRPTHPLARRVNGIYDLAADVRSFSSRRHQ